MRQVFLDTETTGLDPRAGDRIVEIGCVEMVDGCLTGEYFHSYLNPGCEIPRAVQAVHGLTVEFLSDKPRFADIADRLTNFLRGAELVIHNASFDIGFLNAELGRCDGATVESHCASVLDTLRLARNHRPGQRNSLDALCMAFGIDNSIRNHHGALLDARILADVYREMLCRWCLTR